VYGRMILRETGATVREWLGAGLAAYALAPLAALVAFGMSATPLADSLVGIAVCGAVAVGAYWVAAYALALSDSERTLLRARLARMATAAGVGRAS